MKWAIAFFLMILSLSMRSGVADEIGVEELRQRLVDKETELRAPLIVLQDRYEAQLRSRESEAKAKGDLQEVVEIQREIKEFRDPNFGSSDAYAAYPKLGEARAIYRRHLWGWKDSARAVEIELYKAYASRLTDLRDERTRGGDVAAAMLMEKELQLSASILGKLEAMQRWKGKGKFEKTVLWELRHRDDLVENGRIAVEETNGILALSSEMRDMARLESKRHFRPPLRLLARAEAKSTSVRLYYGAGLLVIFNWESRPEELRIHDPTTGFSHEGYPGKGKIEIDRFYDFEARITNNRISIYVDGVLRASRQGDFSKAYGPVGIGPAFGGVVRVQALAVFAEE